MTRLSRTEVLSLLKNARMVCRHVGLDVRAAQRSADLGKILIIIPRKVGSAPERNLIRRRIKAVFYEERFFELPFDWVFFVKPEATAWHFSQMREHMLACRQSLMERVAGTPGTKS